MLSLDNEFYELARPYLPFVIVPAGIFAFVRTVNWLLPGPHHHAKLCYKDKTVLITGASTGLGRALAFEFYKRGAKVILTARSVDKLKELCTELLAIEANNPHEPIYRYLDICEPSHLEELSSLAIDGRTIDVLVNNAGASMRGAVADIPISIHKNVMDVNFFGHAVVTRALLKSIPDDGCIIVTSSVQGKLPLPYRSSYSASKHALQAFFDCLRAEDRPNLHILVVSAGYINTGFGSRAVDVDGKAIGVEDDNQKKGMTPEAAALRIVEAASNRETDIVLAPLVHRFAIFLRWLWPTLFFYFIHKRGQKDEHGRKKHD